MDFFQRLGNFFGGKGWVNDEEKRRKEQQQPAPQPAPRVQQLPPALANRQGLTQQSPATMAIRQRIAQDNDLRRQNLIQRANDELNKSIKDSNGYYKEDADKLRQELNKGNSLNQSRVQGLLQSVQNRRKEIMEGRVPTTRTNQVIQPRPQIPAVTNTNKQLQSMGIDPNPTMSIIRQAEQQKANRLTQQKATQDYLDSRMRAKGKSEEEIAKSRQERIRLDNEAYVAGQQARRSANLANTVGMVTAPVRAPISFTKGAVDGSGRMVGDMGDAISLVMADTAQGITGDEKWQRVRENILKNQQQRHQQYDEQFGAFKANDSDIKFAHELGQAGARLAADTGMAVVTGGTIPAAIHGAEYASNYVTEANAHGKKTKDVLLPAYAGAGVNAAIEKVGINKLLSPGGKTALGNMVRGVISEGTEEGLQQVSENAFAKVYDKDRNLFEGVPKSVAMGGILGGPMGGVNAGGMRRPTSPATTNAIEATVPTASPALKQSVANNVENIQNNDIQAVAKQHGNMGKLESYLVNQTTEEVLNSGVRYKLSPEQEAFFKDSKVRDENGNLKPIYHGTNAEFNSFNPNNTSSNKWGDGNYLAFDKDTAKNYGKNVKEVYANITSPISNKQKTISFEQYDALHRRINDGEPAYLDDYNAYNNDLDLLWDITDRGQWQRYAQDIRETTGKDGLILDDMAISFTPNQTKYTDNLSPTDSPDMRYSIDSISDTGEGGHTKASHQTNALQPLHDTNNLLSRHLQLTGDENLVFNEWRNEMERKALGYYDPKTDQINLNKLTEDTLNHELGHKLLRRISSDRQNGILEQVKRKVGEEALVDQYGKYYGNDLNILAEEWLADNYAKYADARQNGVDINIFGYKFNIPPSIINIYDRIYSAVQSLVGNKNMIKEFYRQAESGELRTSPQVQDGDTRVRTMSLDSNRALETIKKFDDVLRGIRRITKLDTISDETAANIRRVTGLDVQGGASIELTNQNAIHIHNRHIVNPDDPSPLSDYDIAALPEIIKDPDIITKEKEVRGAQRIKFEREMKGNKKAVVEVIKKGNALNVVTYFNDSSSGRPNTDNTVSGYTSETGQLQSTNPGNSVANQDQNVNPRYMLGGENATGFRTAASDGRDFVGIDGKKRFEFSDDSAKLTDTFERVRNHVLNTPLALPSGDVKSPETSTTDQQITGRRPVVTDSELESEALSRYNIRLTKSELNNRIDETIYGQYPELAQNIEILEADIKRLEEAGLHRIKVTTNEAKRLFGSQWREFVPLHLIRKSKGNGAEGVEGYLHEFGSEDIAPEDMIEKIQSYYSSKRELAQLKQEFNEHRYNKDIREIAKEELEMDRFNQANEILGDDMESIANKDTPTFTIERLDEAKAKVKEYMEKATELDKHSFRDLARQVRKLAYTINENIQDMEKTKQMNQVYGNQQPEKANTTDATPGENVPLEEGNLYTKGNLYDMTKSGIDDIWSKGFKDGDYEYRQHEKRVFDKKTKQWKSFQQFERRYIGDGKNGEWMPASRAVYTWKTQTEKIDKVNRDDIIQKALSLAKQDGEVAEFVAYNNTGKEGGVVVQPLTGQYTVDGGFVRDPKSGAIIGNHIQVTPFGVVNQIAGKFDVYETDNLVAQDGKSKGGITDTFIRLVEKNLKSEGGQKLLKDLYYQKTTHYSDYSKEVQDLYSEHEKLVKRVDRYAPFGRKKRFWEDMGRYIENELPAQNGETQQQYIERKYGPGAAKVAAEYKSFTRDKYDTMIERMNAVRRTYGKDEIEYRKNYMPHMQKENNILKRGLDRIMAAVPTGVRGDYEGQARGEIPASIAGLSGDFKPTHKFNASEKSRYGSLKNYELDPRKVFEQYSDVMLYNIHMEPVIARGRSIEASLRAVDQAGAARIDPDSALRNTDDGVSSKLTIAVQDLVNEMAGKSNALDRGMIDRSNTLMQSIRTLQSINGANKILGNLSSTLAQTLNLEATVRDNGYVPTIRSIFKAFDDDAKEAMQNSAFLGERYNDTTGKYSRSVYRKATDLISTASGMNLVERKLIQLNWGANYYRLKKQGLKGRKLIQATDMATERAVGGRGVGAMPKAYRSILGKTFLQFTYEVNENWKNNIEHYKQIGVDTKNGDIKSAGSGTVRAAEAYVTVVALNAIMEAVTGNSPLPDPGKALFEALFGDDTDDKTLSQKGASIAGEFIKMHPGASAATNMIPKSKREEIFGTDSDFARFDGATGVAQTATNLVMTAYNTAKGDPDGIKKGVLGVIPAGSQIKKSLGGYNAMREGVSRTESGKPIAAVNNQDPLKWAQALAFGKNAIQEVRDGYNNNTGPLSDKQTKIYNEIRQKFGADSANSYLNDIHKTRDIKSKLKKASVPSGSISTSGTAELAQAEANINLNSGDWKEENGLIVDKKGNVQKSYYKALAQSQGESDDAYSNWMKAYNIDGAGSTPRRSSGNSMLDKLQAEKDKVSSADTAVKLMLDQEKYRDLPDWVKERYYEKSGYKKHEVEYAALSSYSSNDKLNGYWLPRAKELNHEQLMQELTNGRRESITNRGSMLAPNGVVDNLALRGLISRDEAKALKRAKFASDGTAKSTTSSSGSSRGGRRSSGSSRSGTSATTAIMSAYQQSVQMSKNFSSKVSSQRSAPQVGKRQMKRVSLRKKNSSNSRRTSQRIRLARKT